MKKKNKLKLHELFSNNRFTLAFSFVLAFIIWIAVAMVFSPETKRVIEDVPVQINMENSVPGKFDLQLFGQKEFFVDVTITGKRYVVNSKNITKDSIDVVAQTGYVDSAGRKQLLLKAALVDSTADYQIESISEEYIEAYFDEYKESNSQLTLKIDYDGEEGYIAPGYMEESHVITIDSKVVTDVKISGAAQQINSIDRVYVRVKPDAPLTKTTLLDAEIVPADENGMPLKYIQINGEDSVNANVTISVLKTVDLETEVTFSGVSSAYDGTTFEAEINPSKVKVALAESSLKDTKTLTLKSIPVSLLDAKVNVLTVPKEDVEKSNLKILDNIEAFKVTIDMSHMSKKILQLETNKINLRNNKSSKNFEFEAEPLNVTVIGPADALMKITADDIMAEIDLKNISIASGVNQFTVDLNLNNTDNCWIYGTYQTDVTVK